MRNTARCIDRQHPSGVLIGLMAWLAATVAVRADVLVHDGLPTSGPGAYATGSLHGQDRSHESIVGEIGAWGTGNGTSTTVFQINVAGLSYPLGIELTGQGGAVRMNSTQNGGINARTVGRSLSPTLGGQSFYFSALMAFDDLSSLASGAYVVWGLSKTQVNHDQYPAADGILVGFQKNGTQVDAIVRVLGNTYVLQSGIGAGTHAFAGRFTYNPAGADTVDVRFNPTAMEPLTWTTNVVAEVLTSSQSLAYVNVGGNYGINGKYVAFDEWRVGDTYADALGASPAPAFAKASEATNVTDSGADLVGYLSSTGKASTVVTAYWGKNDGGTDPAGWTGTSVLGTATSPTQIFTNSAFALSLDADTVYFYRLSASNSFGAAWANAPGATFMTSPVWVGGHGPAREQGLVPGTFTVHRASVATNGPVTVGYSVGGSAVAGVHYVDNLTRQVSLGTGATNALVVVTPLKAWADESDRTVTLSLNDGPFILGSPSTAEIAILSLSAASGTWISAAAGATAYNWPSSANWQGGIVADGLGTTADLAMDYTGAGTTAVRVELRQGVTAGTLQLGDTGTGTDRALTIGNAAGETYRLLFDVSAGDAAINSEGGDNAIAAGITLDDNLVINNASKLSLSGGVAGNGGIVKNGAGQLSLYPSVNTFAGGFTLNAGTVYGEANSINVFSSGRLTLNGGIIRHGQSNGSALANKITIGGGFQMDNYVISFNAGDAADAFVLNAANPTVTITASTGTRQHAFNGLISDGPSGGSGWTLACTTTTGTNGVLRLLSSASNTYAGKTRVPSGQLRLEKGGTAIAIPGDLDIGGHGSRIAIVQLTGTSLNQIANAATVTVLDKGRFDLNNKNETIGALVLATGGFVTTGTSGVLTATTLTVDGKLQLADTYTAANLGNFITGSGSVVVLTGPPPCTLLTIR